MSVVDSIENVGDARYFAKRRLPPFLFQVLEGAAGRGVTARANLRAFDDVTFSPNAAVGSFTCDLTTTVVGHQIAVPVCLAPVGFLRMLHPDAELGYARAASAHGTIQVVSHASMHTIEDVIARSSGPVFQQMFFVGGRDRTESMIARVRRAGAAALVITVDQNGRGAPEVGVRQRLWRPPRLGTSLGVREILGVAPAVIPRPRWLSDYLRDGAPLTTAMALSASGEPMSHADFVDAVGQDAVSWSDFSWIREQWDRPVLAKGIVTAEDARRAVDAGADAVIVSNHGGNTLDGLPATLDVLEEIVAAAGDQVEVLLDGGVRRGSDVVKALALGARAVLIGRAAAYANAAAGGAGVERILDVMREDITRTLKFLGCPTASELDQTFVRTRGRDGIRDRHGA